VAMKLWASGRATDNNMDNVNRAVDVATGGVMEHNGGKVAKPYGWTDSRFRDALRGMKASDVIKLGSVNFDYGNRQDGTKKGNGFLGALSRPDGDVSTELSVGVNIGGKEVEIPALVPTLTKQEVDHLVNGGDPTDAIVNKAAAFAKSRIAQGKSPFAAAEESPIFQMGNQKISADQVAKMLPSARLQTVGDGQYAVIAGSDYLRLPNRKPLVLELR